MRKIIYHVATTLDGFIARKDGTTGGFLENGEHVADYLNSLKDYDTVVMGRRTYEYGYDYGLKPGQPAYPHMMHYIFSRSLRLEYCHEQLEVISSDEVGFINHLKQSVGSPIYLCGGGVFAGFLLKHKLIDELKIKINPVLFGDGIRLFGDNFAMPALHHVHSVSYDTGVIVQTYDLKYSDL